ncbi:MAG TPA: hypothetical protein VFM65_04815 [Flavobacteriaceae bacterium]|nr:hypothetical protein [Flavobacteriaceae bacterium]
MRKVTKPEIEKLYQFTRKHYVEYFDLQNELVDHLANGMEARWEENPHVEFEENLNLEFKKFGIFGFSEVVEKRKAAMQKRYLKLIWKEMLWALRDPKMLFFTVIFTGICTFLMRFETGFMILYWGIIAMTVAEMIYFFRSNFLFRKRMKTQKKTYLLEEMIGNTGGIHLIFLFPFYFLSTLDAIEIWESGILSFLFALFVSIMVFMAYVAFCTLPKKKEEILEKAYPQRKMMG